MIIRTFLNNISIYINNVFSRYFYPIMPIFSISKTINTFIDNLELFSLLANVADVKSLVIHPASTTHSQLTDEELASVGIYRNTVRVSIGTEHIDDIIEDLELAFRKTFN